MARSNRARNTIAAQALALVASTAQASNSTIELNGDLSNLASYAAQEFDNQRNTLTEGKPNPAMHVLPGTLTAVVRNDTRADKVWLTYAEAATTAGLKIAMLPPAVKYGSEKATPEYNLLYSTVASTLFGDNCAAVMGAKEAIKGGLEDKRKDQQVSIGRIVSKVRGYLERFSAQAGTTSGIAGEAEAKASTKRAPRVSANQAALDGEVVVLLKEVHEAILNQPHATLVLTSLVKRIESMLDKAKAAPAKAG